VKPRTVYLILGVVGVALPYWQFIPWLAANGLDLKLFATQLFANRISAFFGMDVIVSAVTLLIFVRREKRHLPGIARLLPLIAVVTVGVSLALPLFLYLRERDIETATPERS
jgi:hypothetical protein